MVGGKTFLLLCLLVSGISSKPSQSDEEKKRASYEEYLDKMSRVKTIDDFKREFNIKEDSNSFTSKRNAAPKILPNPPCSIKDMTEKINYNSPSSRIFPTCLTVKRCEGCCTAEKSCTPTKTEKKQANIFVSDIYNSQNYKYDTVDYVDHTECQCQCKRKATDCKPNQTFNSNTCLCDCPSSAQTTCAVRKQWSTFDCGCVCSNKSPQCPANHVWNTDTCECKKVVQPTCSSGSFNSTSCKCQ